MIKKKINIIGSGPGGLAAGIILASKGYDVELFEKKSIVGGRNGFIKKDGFTFDIGPTFFMMKEILEDIFNISGRSLHDYVEIKKLDPMYKLVFKDKVFHPSSDKDKMTAEIEKVFPGNTKGYEKYHQREKIKYNRLIPCLQVPYGSLSDYLKKNFLRSLPYLDAHISLYDVLRRYYSDDELRLAFTFQAKYIGMSPWEAPGTFSIISYIEHGGGIYHITGGLNKLAEAMAKVISEFGGKIHLNSPVRQIIVDENKAIGIELETGEKMYSDFTVINADFAYAMKNLVSQENRKKYNDSKIDKMDYSCSTFMLYLGLDKIYSHLNHHNIFFADNYRQNVNDISKVKVLSDDFSFYIQNASLTDSTLAPEGHSAIYVLVPVPNNTGNVKWEKEKVHFENKILDAMERKAGMDSLREHLVYKKIVTPDDWEDKMQVYNGATFNLGHGVNQMLYFRPHNEFEEFGNCYLVGGGTHPGSGLPTIYESGRISAELIMKK